MIMCLLLFWYIKVYFTTVTLIYLNIVMFNAWKKRKTCINDRILTVGPLSSCTTVLGTGPETRGLQQELCHGQVRHQVVHYVTVQWLGVRHSLGGQPARDVEAWSIVMQKHSKFNSIIINLVTLNSKKTRYLKICELNKEVFGTFNHFDVSMVLLISMFNCMYFEIYTLRIVQLYVFWNID